MTTIQANAIKKAQEEVKRARKELERIRLSETSYRGVPTVNNWVKRDVHGTFVYRGVEYTK